PGAAGASPFTTRSLRTDAALGKPPGSTRAVVDRSKPSRVTTSFVGRRRELAAVRALLDRSALVTLWGAGGVGKTRLANEVARQAQARGEAVWVVSLGGRHGAAVVIRGLRDIGVDVRDGNVAETLEREADGRRGIVVLDECEAELEQVADVI